MDCWFKHKQFFEHFQCYAFSDFRTDISKQSKDIESLKKKIVSLNSVKQGLEKDKERFKQDLNKKNKVYFFSSMLSFEAAYNACEK